MKLDILICTLPEEYSIKLLKRLTNILNPQIERHSEVSLHIHDAGRSMPTGTKRNKLIKNTDGDYFVFIDSDDVVPAYYVDEMLKAIDQGPDVVTFNGYMTTDGTRRENFTIRLGSEYVSRGGHHFRWPNHLTCMRRDKVEQIKFPDIWVQEDYLWSKTIHERRLLKSEVHIDKDLYWYDYISKHRRK